MAPPKRAVMPSVVIFVLLLFRAASGDVMLCCDVSFSLQYEVTFNSRLSVELILSGTAGSSNLNPAV